MSGHPLQRYVDLLAAVGARRLADLTQPDAECATGGVVTSVRQLKTRRGDRMATFLLEDEAAKTEAVVFPEAFGRFGGHIADDAMLLVKGKYEHDEDTSRLVASEITPLEVVREQVVREVEVRIASRGAGRDLIRQLAGVFDRHPGDRRVSLVVEVRDGGRPMRVRTATARRIRPSDRFVRDVEALCGHGSVRLK